MSEPLPDGAAADRVGGGQAEAAEFPVDVGVAVPALPFGGDVGADEKGKRLLQAVPKVAEDVVGVNGFAVVAGQVAFDVAYAGVGLQRRVEGQAAHAKPVLEGRGLLAEGVAEGRHDDDGVAEFDGAPDHGDVPDVHRIEAAAIDGVTAHAIILPAMFVRPLMACYKKRFQYSADTMWASSLLSVWTEKKIITTRDDL